MLRAFVDESERDEAFYFLGSIVCSIEQEQFLTERLDAIMAKHAATADGLEPDTEFHGSTMMRASEEPWRSVPLRLRFRIYEEALEAIRDSGASIYIEGVDVVGQAARGYPVLTPARELAFSHLFEQINGCWSVDEPPIKIIADDHHTAEISRSNFRSYQSTGTYGYRSSKLPHVDPSIDFIDSSTSRALQCADLLTYLYNRISTVNETDKRAHDQKWNMWRIVVGSTQWPNGRARTWP
ncbi:DUF3800 domain-containing protein [Rathayibacter sp. AY1C9]|uniref:DUF3800 domain-containing protein n=1 Tax=Rathayibacter sp. AY1C9 TaxID=2080541 RepID=UPI0015E3CBB8|nr:DUF3800 domain-containing protein [Rathayibacter sp. AY1C9]